MIYTPAAAAAASAGRTRQDPSGPSRPTQNQVPPDRGRFPETSTFRTFLEGLGTMHQQEDATPSGTINVLNPSMVLPWFLPGPSMVPSMVPPWFFPGSSLVLPWFLPGPSMVPSCWFLLTLMSVCSQRFLQQHTGNLTGVSAAPCWSGPSAPPTRAHARAHLCVAALPGRRSFRHHHLCEDTDDQTKCPQSGCRSRTCPHTDGRTHTGTGVHTRRGGGVCGEWAVSHADG